MIDLCAPNQHNKEEPILCQLGGLSVIYFKISAKQTIDYPVYEEFSKIMIFMKPKKIPSYK